jgi:arylsulfatase A
MKKACLFVALLGLLMTLPGRLFAADAGAKPNIIFILADDLGLDGVSCCGADSHKTPNIDALAKSGTRFETCYAAPLCGPSRCLFVTGQYAYHTGGLTNGSWNDAKGKGPHGADSVSVAKSMKKAGYATCQSGKWRQVGDTPKEWGFDEYLTDQTASGWYWEKKYAKNGQEINLPKEEYMPDIEQAFAVDFINRHKDKPFFLYYAMHLVHKPSVSTPDSSNGADQDEKARHKSDEKFYNDNINYMDKQVGEMVELLTKLGLREKTLVVFSGDNGTAVGYPSPLKGRMINGAKASMWEGGSRVTMIASQPGVVPADKVSKDIVSFADLHATFAEYGGGPVPAGMTDGISFSPQLHGEAGQPRKWAYVQLGANWFVREQGWKMNEQGQLFDMSDAPYVEKLVEAAGQSPQATEARTRLKAALDSLNPAGGKTQEGGAAKKKKKAAK